MRNELECGNLTFVLVNGQSFLFIILLIPWTRKLDRKRDNILYLITLQALGCHSLKLLVYAMRNSFRWVISIMTLLYKILCLKQHIRKVEHLQLNPLSRPIDIL